MPLAKKKFLLFIIPIIILSAFSGCIFEDIFGGGTSFILTDLNINDDDIPLFKLHGNPIYYICPKCKGMNKYKIIDPTIQIPDQIKCKIHDLILERPKIILPNEKIDSADIKLIEYIKNKISKFLQKTSLLDKKVIDPFVPFDSNIQ